MTSIKTYITEGIQLLKNPEKGFIFLNKKTLEYVVGAYLRLLLVIAFVAGAVNLLFSLGRTLFFDLTRTLEVDYAVIINYRMVESFSLIFSYLMVGTFLMFIISTIIKIFYKKLKYTELLKIMLYSTYPLLLFSFVPYIAISLLIWSIFIFSIGMKMHKSHKISKDSIKQRD
jgi:hypothetical protein